MRSWMPTEYAEGALVWWWPVHGQPQRAVVGFDGLILGEGWGNFRKISGTIPISLEKIPWFVWANHLDLIPRTPEETA